MPELSSFKIINSGTENQRGRDSSRAVVLIGFQRQGNLGLGYLASTLRSCGYRVEVFDFEADREKILRAVKAMDPVLVGFSLIFQFYIRRFDALLKYLRAHGVACHFTMGGHFPSLNYEDTLEMIADLDSVVRFEGELTLLELVDLLSTGDDWRGIQGIAYKRGAELIANPMRPLVEDLDRLPYPERTHAPDAVLGRPVMPLLASRGCARTCSFCSIHMFYRTAPGKVVRTRKPAQVVRELRELHEERGIRIFLFQDDDFPLYGPVWRRWAGEFVDELHRNGLPGRVIWKMNCRADVVDPDMFSAMRDAGLYLVYMGLESGSEQGLKTLHKQITVEQNIRAVEILKQVGLMFEFGFMLFDPSSTFTSVRENLSFLRTIVGDGSAGAVFCRMLPYDGTPIKDELARTGRLLGDVCNPSYNFLDPKLDAFYAALTQVISVTGWIHGYRALSPQLNGIWHEAAVIERLFPCIPELPPYKDTLREITKASNDLLLRVVEDMSYTFSDGRENPWSAQDLERQCGRWIERLVDERNDFVGRNRRVLLDALHQEELEQPALA
jgi:anaerobic magnesium-protoporphyrin IX monomethyl ester cyclase